MRWVGALEGKSMTGVWVHNSSVLSGVCAIKCFSNIAIRGNILPGIGPGRALTVHSLRRGKGPFIGLGVLAITEDPVGQYS